MTMQHALFIKGQFINTPSIGPPKRVNQKKTKKVVKEEKKLQDLVASEESIFKAASIFPFDLFPNEITIEENKVNVTDNMFFFTKQYHSIPIGNIQDIYVITVPFFSSLKIIYGVYREENTVLVKFLKTDEAIHARRIIQGLIIAYKNQIDITKIEKHRLTVELEELGKAHETESEQ